ncbi:MAG TPA: DUF1343 domain-containing protein [Gemmatimonadales bacterium]|nr:DUF1343 domain-containing protein [Gemmatimonadales bacterium]
MWSAACAACGAGPGQLPASARQQAVRPGIEVLLSDSMHLVRGRRVGLVTNQSGVDSRGRRDVDRLLAAGVRVTALFGPEHGFNGRLDVDTRPAGAVERDSATGLPVYALHDGVRPIGPTPAMLADIDILLLDLQDAGARYYTYAATAVLVMQSAATARIPVVVLDRPDPIGGLVQGNALDSATPSAVARLPVAMRHGMTLGELARLANGVLGLGADLTVVPVAGWRRTMALDQTGLPLVPPSLNLRSMESLFHYPGLCLFEGTALSVGRGSDAPFEQIGAPWLDAAGVVAALGEAPMGGVRFSAVRFTPDHPGDGKFDGQRLNGIRLHVTDRARYDPTATAVYLLSAITARHPGRIALDSARFDRLAGGPALRQALERAEDPAAIVRSWEPARRRFLERRRPYLIYGDVPAR